LTAWQPNGRPASTRHEKRSTHSSSAPRWCEPAGTVARAAEELGVTRQGLTKLMVRLGLNTWFDVDA
jgi:hypothetical protein